MNKSCINVLFFLFMPLVAATSASAPILPDSPIVIVKQNSGCQSSGTYADPSNCRKYHICTSIGSNFAKFDFECPPGTAFNPTGSHCDLIYNVPTCRGGTSLNSKLQAPLRSPSRQEFPSYSEVASSTDINLSPFGRLFTFAKYNNLLF